jgi:hypothetical protein
MRDLTFHLQERDRSKFTALQPIGEGPRRYRSYQTRFEVQCHAGTREATPTLKVNCIRSVMPRQVFWEAAQEYARVLGHVDE